MELCIQWVFAGYNVDPVSTVLVSKSTFDLVSLRKLSPKMRGVLMMILRSLGYAMPFGPRVCQPGQFPVWLMFHQWPGGVYNEIQVAWPGD